jgi:hypothetical protein
MLVASQMTGFVYTTLALLYLDTILLTLVGFAGERAKDLHLNNLLRRVCTMSELSSMSECKDLGSVIISLQVAKNANISISIKV